MTLHRPTRRRQHGQALVEFAFAIIPFLVLLMAVVDLGLGIYQLNGTAAAAREISRVTAVHLSDSSKDLGTSPESVAVIATQRSLLPSILFTASTDIVCVDLADAVKPDPGCGPGDFVRVRVRSTFNPVTPIVMIFGAHTLESYARTEVP